MSPAQFAFTLLAWLDLGGRAFEKARASCHHGRIKRTISLVACRKICKSCKCSQEDHSLSSDLEDDRKIGRLLTDSKYATLTARVKGGDGVRIYKRNRMIITNPIVSRKDPTFDTITYEWAPPGLTQKLVREHGSALE